MVDIGTRLGPYEITGRLGAGGMGQVFKARDTRLNRTVAIKVSNEAFTARFEHEARAVAALNHPNICQLYDVGPNYLVLEYVAGTPLMPTDSVRKLLDVAVQIADGMSAAHEAGFVHRDLKPSNLLVTSEGRVKILDFGLVKSVAAENKELTVTAEGLIAGTTAYMSPEQARGDATLDSRSDQFSFGLVLYELATRKRPFDGATGVETLAAILRDEPEPLPATLPAPLRWIVTRCLSKERRDRYASTRDLYLELKSLQTHLADASATDQAIVVTGGGVRRKRRREMAAFAAGAVLTVALAASLGVRVPREAPDLRFTPFSFESGGQGTPVWSPDGQSVAFAARQRVGDPPQIYVRALDAPAARKITSAGASGLMWTSGLIQWTSDDRILFVTPDNTLWSILEVGGEPEPLLQLPSGTVAISRDGSAIAYLERNENGVGMRVRSPLTAEPQWYEPAPFASDTFDGNAGLQFSPDGRQLLLMQNVTAWLMPYPADPKVPPRRILEPLPLSPVTNTPQFSWLPDSRHIVLSANHELTGPAHLFLADTVSGELSTLSRDTTSKSWPAVSPDGSKLIFVEWNLDHDVVQLNLDDATVTPLVASAALESMPAWAGREPAMVYFSNRNGPPEIWLHEPGEVDRPLVTAGDFPGATLWFMAPSLSPAADRLIYGRLGLETEGLYISAVAGGPPVPLVTSSGPVYPGSWSPDGSWYVYLENAGATRTLKKVRTSGQAEPETLRTGLTGGSGVPVWSPRNDAILYQDRGLKLISLDGTTIRDLGLRANCAFARDGAHLYCIQPGPDAPDGTPRLLHVDLDGNIERNVGSIAREHFPVIPPQAYRLTTSPDGTSITYSVSELAQNLWLLDGLETVPLP